MPAGQNMPVEVSEELKEFAKNNKSDKLADLLQANLDRNEEILKISREIKKYMHWQNIWGITRILVIVVPIVLGLIYLPPLIKDYIESYKTLLQ